MSNSLLATVYCDVYQERFSSTDFSKRVKMQKLVYLLQEAGISLGDYSFFWYKHGPYCQKLQDDILYSNFTNNEEIHYSDNAYRTISKFKDLFQIKTDYNQIHWVECLASLQYLRSNVFAYDAKPKDIISKLESLKPHLNNTEVNNLAFQKLQEVL